MNCKPRLWMMVFPNGWANAGSLIAWLGLIAITSTTAGAASANSHSPTPIDSSNEPLAQDATAEPSAATVSTPIQFDSQSDAHTAIDSATPQTNLSASFAFQPSSQIAAVENSAGSSPAAPGANPSAPFAFAPPAVNPSIAAPNLPAAVAQIPYAPPNAVPGYPVQAAPPSYPIQVAPGYYAYPVGQAPYAAPMPPGYAAAPQSYPLQPVPAQAYPPPVGYPAQSTPFPGYAAPATASYPVQATSGYPTQVPPGYMAQPAPGYAYPGFAQQPAPGYGYAAPTAAGYPMQAAPGYPTQVPPGYAQQPAPSYAFPPGYAQQPAPSYAFPGYPAPGYPAPGYPVQTAPVYPVQPVPSYPAAVPGYPVQTAPVYPAPAPIAQPSAPLPATAQRPSPIINSTALTLPSVRLQGVYTLQGEDSSARARLSAVYPITPRLLFGGTLDLTNGRAFTDSQSEGLSLNELYLAASLGDLPNLRFVIGQLDLTSYFDRNSFAKDGASQFFNPVFQTNPALSAASIGSRPGLLINWSLNDNIEARAAAFSSSRDIGDFSLDGFAGELGLRFGNAIIRGTYVSARDGGSNSSFQEIYRLDRGNGITGVGENDRENSYGVNAEIFIPELNAGIFGRYGRYEDTTANVTGDTYSGGISFLDVFSRNDRLGLAYGRNLSNDRLRRDQGSRNPDVLELFYDFRVLPNVSLGFTYQALNNFSESIAGVRIRTEFDVTPRGL